MSYYLTYTIQYNKIVIINRTYNVIMKLSIFCCFSVFFFCLIVVIFAWLSGMRSIRNRYVCIQMVFVVVVICYCCKRPAYCFLRPRFWYYLIRIYMSLYMNSSTCLTSERAIQFALLACTVHRVIIFELAFARSHWFNTQRKKNICFFRYDLRNILRLCLLIRFW